jgi:hypothetical protein
MCVFVSLKGIDFSGIRVHNNYMDVDKSLQILIMESIISSGWRNILSEIRI